MNDLQPKEIFAANQALTLDAAHQLKGHTISCTSPEYHANQCHVTTFIVGDIVSELEYAYTQKYPQQIKSKQYLTFGEYWKSYMSQEQIKEVKNTLIIMDTDGKKNFKCNPNSGWYEVPTFFGSDADREVYFIDHGIISESPERI